MGIGEKGDIMEPKNIQRLRDLGKFDLMMVNAQLSEALQILNRFKTGQIDPREMRKLGSEGADHLRACEARIDEIRDEMERLLGNSKPHGDGAPSAESQNG